MCFSTDVNDPTDILLSGPVPPVAGNAGTATVTTMPRTACSWTVRTASGKVDIRRAAVTAALPDGGVRVITRGEQLERLERHHGRLPLTVTPHAGEPVSTSSQQATWSTLPALPGLTAPAITPDVMTVSAIAHKLRAQLTTTEPDTGPAPQPAWDGTTRSSDALGADKYGQQWQWPVDDAFQRMPLTQQDRHERFQAALTSAAHALFDPAGVGSADGFPWWPMYAEATDASPQTSSGVKLHIYSASNVDTFEALRRALPEILGREMQYKFALRETTMGPADQANKGVVIYLPRRETLAEDAAAVVAAMGGWRHNRAVAGDAYLGNGVSMRQEHAIDFGGSVPARAAAMLYEPADTYSARDPEEAATMNAWRASLRSAKDIAATLTPEGAELMRDWVCSLTEPKHTGAGLLAAAVLARAGMPADASKKWAVSKTLRDERARSAFLDLIDAGATLDDALDGAATR